MLGYVCMLLNSQICLLLHLRDIQIFSYFNINTSLINMQKKVIKGQLWLFHLNTVSLSDKNPDQNHLFTPYAPLQYDSKYSLSNTKKKLN